jgi:hypothetical protein
MCEYCHRILLPGIGSLGFLLLAAALQANAASLARSDIASPLHAADPPKTGQGTGRSSGVPGWVNDAT